VLLAVNVLPAPSVKTPVPVVNVLPFMVAAVNAPDRDRDANDTASLLLRASLVLAVAAVTASYPVAVEFTKSALEPFPVNPASLSNADASAENSDLIGCDDPAVDVPGVPVAL
jgi:hypothetical protein